MMLDKPLQFSHKLLKDNIVRGDCVIDATVGKGNDTVLLAQLVGPYGKVYGFDIQEEALSMTKEKLLLTGLLPQTKLILDGHEKMDKYILEHNSIRAVTFNLGYLPGGDKKIITKPTTTISALNQCLPLLRKQGIISIMVYSGHDGGKEEMRNIDEFVRGLPQENYQVLSYRFINQVNNPPYLYIVEKK